MRTLQILVIALFLYSFLNSVSLDRSGSINKVYTTCMSVCIRVYMTETNFASEIDGNS